MKREPTVREMLEAARKFHEEFPNEAEYEALMRCPKNKPKVESKSLPSRPNSEN